MACGLESGLAVPGWEAVGFTRGYVRHDCRSWRVKEVVLELKLAQRKPSMLFQCSSLQTLGPYFVICSEVD